MKNILLTALVLLLSGITAPLLAQEKIKPVKVTNLKVPEPSDVCLSPDGSKLYIVSDNGYLYECSLEGEILREAEHRGFDFEAVAAVGDEILVVEEMMRKIKVFRMKDLVQSRSIDLPYGGGRNKAYEALTFNAATQQYYLLTEKEPTYINVLNDKFEHLNQVRFKAARDISAATWNMGYLWLLSDEDATIFKVDPDNFAVLQSWRIPVINPEGLAFMPDGSLVITSDDLEKLYTFKLNAQ